MDRNTTYTASPGRLPNRGARQSDYNGTANLRAGRYAGGRRPAPVHGMRSLVTWRAGRPICGQMSAPLAPELVSGGPEAC